jgi:hypothetical protein
MKLNGSILINSGISHRLSKYSREIKLSLFRRIVNKTKSRSILDVGVGIEWQGAHNTLHEAFSLGTINAAQLVACGIDDLSEIHIKYKDSTFVYGNGLTLPFRDNSFDIAYSNAVIEHVFPVSERKRFVEEMLRVAQGVFITTPNKWFPIEVHSRLPFVHWLPADLNNKVLRFVGLSNLSRGSYFEPLSISNLLSYFPKPKRPNVKLGFLGMTIIAWYFKDQKDGIQ